MNRRSRTLVALLALFALSAFLTERAWALVCAPGMAACEAGMETCTAEPAASTDAGAITGAAHHAGPTSDHSDRAPSSGAHPCPMAVASGGCAVAALPATAAVTEAVVVQDNVVLPSFDRTPDLLLVAGHFRPPRA